MTHAGWMPDAPRLDPTITLELTGGADDSFITPEENAREAERLQARRPAGFHPNPRTTDMDTLTRTRPMHPNRWNVRPVLDGVARAWAISPPTTLHPRQIRPRIVVANPNGPGLTVRPASHTECLQMAQRWARHPDEFRTYLQLQEFPGRVRS